MEYLVVGILGLALLGFILYRKNQSKSKTKGNGSGGGRTTNNPNIKER